MGRKLTGQTLEPTPVVGITQKIGGKFVGTLVGERKEVKMKRGKKAVYLFTIEDSDMPVQIKGEDSRYKDIDVEPGEKVAIFAPTVLDRALSNVKLGERVQAIYLGEATGKNGNYHNFDAEVL